MINGNKLAIGGLNLKWHPDNLEENILQFIRECITIYKRIYYNLEEKAPH